MLMISLATSSYLEMELLNNTEVEFTAEDVFQLDDSESILQLITPFSCISSSDFIENNIKIIDSPGVRDIPIIGWKKNKRV